MQISDEKYRRKNLRIKWRQRVDECLTGIWMNILSQRQPVGVTNFAIGQKIWNWFFCNHKLHNRFYSAEKSDDHGRFKLFQADLENPYLKNKIKDVISRTLKTPIFEIL